MSNDLTPRQIEDMRKQLEQTRNELEAARRTPAVIQQNLQDKFIETLFDKGSEIFKEWSKNTSETQKYIAEKKAEYNKTELDVINKLDTKEKLYKGILIIICIIALIVAAVFINKAEVIIPVISLIIGLLFKSNSLTTFFSHSKTKSEEEDSAQ